MEQFNHEEHIDENLSMERMRPIKCKNMIHVIEQGDTLYKLSKRYDVKLFDIMRLNPFVNVYNLQRGEEIYIPVGEFVEE